MEKSESISTPPAMIKSAWPDITFAAAVLTASKPDPQNRRHHEAGSCDPVTGLQRARSGQIAALIVILFATSKYYFIRILLDGRVSVAQFPQKRTDQAQAGSEYGACLSISRARAASE